MKYLRSALPVAMLFLLQCTSANTCECYNKDIVERCKCYTALIRRAQYNKLEKCCYLDVKPGDRAMAEKVHDFLNRSPAPTLTYEVDNEKNSAVVNVLVSDTLYSGGNFMMFYFVNTNTGDKQLMNYFITNIPTYKADKNKVVEELLRGK